MSEQRVDVVVVGGGLAGLTAASTAARCGASTLVSRTLNEDPKAFVWHKTADEILERLGRYSAAVTTTEFVDGSA